MDSCPLIIAPEIRKDSFHPDFLNEYPDAHEDIAADFATAYYGPELEQIMLTTIGLGDQSRVLLFVLAARR